MIVIPATRVPEFAHKTRLNAGRVVTIMTMIVVAFGLRTKRKWNQTNRAAIFLTLKERASIPETVRSRKGRLKDGLPFINSNNWANLVDRIQKPLGHLPNHKHRISSKHPQMQGQRETWNLFRGLLEELFCSDWIDHTCGRLEDSCACWKSFENETEVWGSIQFCLSLRSPIAGSFIDLPDDMTMEYVVCVVGNELTFIMFDCLASVDISAMWWF